MRDDDATIRVRTAALPRHSRFLPALAAGGAALLLLCGGIAGWVIAWPLQEADGKPREGGDDNHRY
jgi:hypothetical protein